MLGHAGAQETCSLGVPLSSSHHRSGEALTQEGRGWVGAISQSRAQVMAFVIALSTDKLNQYCDICVLSTDTLKDIFCQVLA